MKLTKKEFIKLENDYWKLFNEFQSKKQEVIIYEQSFNLVIANLKTIDEIGTKQLPSDIYKIAIEHIVKRIKETLQSHIDK